MNTQTEAERLAIALTDHVEYYGDGFSEEQGCLAAAELRRQASFINDLEAEILEQCRINGMSAEREDALRAEVDRLKKALAKQPAPVQEPAAWIVTTEMQDGTRRTFAMMGRLKDVIDCCDFGIPVPLYTKIM